MSRYDDDLIVQLKKEGKTWKEIGDVFGVKGERVRAYSRNRTWYKEIRDPKHMNIDLIGDKNPKLETFHSKTTLSDGSISSSIRERLLEKKQFTEKELLELHGFSSEEFKIKTVTSNEWSMTNSEGEKYYNFQSKIIAELLRSEDKLIEQLEELITKYAKPFEVKRNIHAQGTNNKANDKSIVIPLADMHFGFNTCDDYRKYQQQIYNKVSQDYNTIIISILGDWLHTSNFIHTTEAGTRVNDTNIPLAWEEASKFIEPLIQRALFTTQDVRLIYSRGNHDESMTWGFCKYLEVKYPQVKIDVSLDQLKVTTVDKVALYFSHGHKAKAKLPSLCASLYPKEWGETNSRLLFTGHLHHQQSRDHTGIVQYQLPTCSKSTDWEEENLFLGSDKGIHLFEIMNSKISAIYYL